jgi:Ca-activated chloride channel family protein
MKQRYIACFAALAIWGTACGSSDDKASQATSSPRVAAGAATATTAASAATAAATAVTVAAAETTAAATETTEASASASASAAATTTAPIPGTAAESEADGATETIPGVPEQTLPPIANPITDPAIDPLSTFAMDVDTGSYTYARGSLQNGVVPTPAAVRTEEFVNAQAQDYAAPVDNAFALTLDGTTAPFLPGDTRVVRVGIQSRTVADADRQDANLTFVVDISGSMADPGKLEAVRPALHALVESLRPTDRVGIVVYSDATRVLLPSTPVSERQAIDGAIDQLQTEGSTNVEQGLRLGYEQARASLDPGRIDRVILLSDGVANVGATGPEAILEIIGDAARDGIDLVTVGFGLGDYNDRLMEQLADQSDGFYAYVDGEREAVRLFSEDLAGTLQTVAREAKVQVEFNPATVSSYRLIGFENRAVADDDFRNDAVDGGEVGAGHTVTALYEVALHEGASAPDAWLARGVIRWLDPDTSAASELETSLLTANVSGSIGESPLRLQQDVYVAAFAETLRGSGWSGLISLDGLSQNLHSLATRLADESLTEVANLVDDRINLG